MVAVPVGLRTSGKHVLAVMVRDDNHNEDWLNEGQKEGRGLISATLDSAADGLAWKIKAPPERKTRCAVR